MSDDGHGALAETGTETEPHPAPIFDTGPHPQPLGPRSDGADLSLPDPWAPQTFAADVAVPDSPPAPGPVAVPPARAAGRHHFLKWWKLVLVLVGVWVPAAAIGLGLFSWWHLSLDKTPVVFVVLVYVGICTVGGLVLAMVEDHPLVSALAIAVMSAVFASAVAAAPLYGYYYCQQVGPCVAGFIPH